MLGKQSHPCGTPPTFFPYKTFLTAPSLVPPTVPADFGRREFSAEKGTQIPVLLSLFVSSTQCWRGGVRLCPICFPSPKFTQREVITAWYVPPWDWTREGTGQQQPVYRRCSELMLRHQHLQIRSWTALKSRFQCCPCDSTLLDCVSTYWYPQAYGR